MKLTLFSAVFVFLVVGFAASLLFSGLIPLGNQNNAATTGSVVSSNQPSVNVQTCSDAGGSCKTSCSDTELGGNYVCNSGSCCMPAFVGNNFVCLRTSNGNSCSLSYTNRLAEKAVVAFYAIDDSGAVVTIAYATASSGTGHVSVNFNCDVHKGQFAVSWRAFAQSDTLMKNTFAFSKQSEKQTMTC